MALMLPMPDLSNEDERLLKSLSSMLSNGSRLHQHWADPRIATLLLQEENPKVALMRASEDAVQALHLVQKIIGGDALPDVAFSELSLSPKNDNSFTAPQTYCNENDNSSTTTQTYSQLQQELENNHYFSLSRSEWMSNPIQTNFREQQITHMLEDLPYHFSIIEEILNQATHQPLPLSLLAASLHHLGHALEKSLKISSFYLALPSELNPENHIAFDLVDGRLRAYHHNLMRNLELLDTEDLELSKEEREAITKLSDFSTFTRYPAQQKGELPELLEKAALHSTLTEDLLTIALQKTAENMFGPKQSEWAEKSRNMVMGLQTEELLPLAKTLLGATEKLLAFALKIRQ